MSFFWALMIGLSVINLCTAIYRNEYDLWLIIEIALLVGSVLYYLSYLRSEKLEAEAKRQLINIFINHVDPDTATASAKKVAEQLRHDL
jgi:hypothetical protein